MDQTLGLILHEAEQAGYGLLASLREGDDYYDKLADSWITVKKIQAKPLGPGETQLEQLCYVVGTDEEGNKRTLSRPLFNLYLTNYTDEHFQELFGEQMEQHQAGGIW